MKYSTISIKDIARHPNLSLSASDYKDVVKWYGVCAVCGKSVAVDDMYDGETCSAECNLKLIK